MNKKIKRIIQSKASKRVISGLTAFVLMFGIIPLSDIKEELDNLDLFSITATAESDTTDADDPDDRFQYTTDADGNHNLTIFPSQLVEYSEHCQKYHKYHQYDIVTISIQGNEDMAFFQYGFKGLGTEERPFGGAIKIEPNQPNITLNIDASLFNYVYDNVTLYDPNNSSNGNALRISREYDLNQADLYDSKQPLLAKHVLPNTKGASPATWKIEVNKPTAGNRPYLANFGGFIGTMRSNAELTIDLMMNTESGDTGNITVEGTDNSDIGLICGTMESSSNLDFTFTSDRAINSITTEYGHAGGLVGSMDEGSVFKYTGTNLQTSATDIKTTAADKYAGGIVGYNNGGTVEITLPSGVTSYPISQYIEGTSGAGGLFGYYIPGDDETEDDDFNLINNTFDSSKYSINCQVNGTGYDGGLFGVLESNHSYSVVGSSTVTSTHNSGLADGYGGLIGRYNNSDLTKELSIGNVTVNSTRNTDASVSYYGGAVAFVGNSVTEEGSTDGGSAYVKLNGLTVNATNADAMTFGGLAAKSDNAFIDANNVKITVTGEHKFKGGAVVGSLESGVLRMTGYTDVSETLADAASYRAGQIVGYRNNALIFGGDGWKLRRTSSNVEVDDIGSWGEIVRFDAKDTSTEGKTKYGFGSDATVVIVDESAHTVTIAEPTIDEDDGSTIIVGSSSDFAKAALNMQLESQSDVLQFENSGDYLSTNIKLDADLVLSGLGISSFTRDNAETDSDTADKCVYSGTFDGNGHSVTLAIGEPYGYHINSSGETPVEIAITDHTTEGSGKIYRHRYNGLFGITSTSSGDDYGNNAKNVTFDGYITVKANDTVYVGSVAGLATNDFRVDSVNMIDTITSGVHSTEFKIEGSKSAYVGGVVGKTTNSVENLSIKNCNVVVNINSGNSEDGSCCGGIIGWSNRTGQSADWDFINDTVSGSISRSGKHEVNKFGGLVAAITEYSGTSEREIELTNVNISDLSISATGSADKDSSVGGLLGYSWLNVNPTFHNVQVSDGSSVTLSDTASEKGDLAGLVYQGTGHWIIETSSADVEVPDIDEETGEQKKDEETGEPLTTTVTEYYDGIKINSIAVSSTNAKSFGMIINKGMADNSAIFLDVRADDTTNSKKSYLISSATLTGLGSCIFDELVAYSATDGKVLENGQGIVSIHTGLTTDGTTSSKTYQAQTSRGAVPNNKTRYYYDLDTIREASGDKDLLMRWALNLYAHKSLSDYFTTSWVTDTTNNVSTIPYGIYDMENYSWYPINISGTVTVNGEFKFYNDEFEKSEAAKGGTYPYTRTSLYDSTADKATQHHLMHCGLFYNVSGGVTVGSSDITLQGNVGRFGKKTGSSDSKVSGALICGTIKGSSTSSIATFSTSGNIYLDGIYVHDHNSNSYAPLLINKIGEFSTIVVKNVKAKTSSSYTTDFKAASSLIGDVGASSATNINLTFADIQIDGRKTSGAYSLDSVYNTKSSLFYRATLLNTFRYSSGSATYDFKIGDDWKTSGDTYTRTGAKGVTYGSEIDDADSQHLGKEYWYKDTNGGIYTNYNTPGASGTGATSVSFSDFLPYVYSKCTASAIETADDKKYQIKVNWADTHMSGCGTYNDPYIITSGDDFVRIANILNGDKSLTISLPKIANNNSVDATKLKQKKWDDFGHTDFTGNGTNYISTADSSKSYTPEVVQNYLAGAYYKIEPNATIKLPSDFAGFCNQNNEEATFRGVIVGTDETITLTGDNPLIYQSNGCVVKGLNIVVNKSTTINISQTNPTAFSYGTNSGKAYGAVIGKILGGDNIIDDVTVSFGNSKIQLTGNAAQTVPVGGYVGVVVKGSLIFRGMEDYRASSALWNSISGLGTTTVIDNNNHNDLLYTDVASKTPNMKWLYVNPIVGRVINAAVFTEGDAYRPFEDGTREGVSAEDTTYEKYSQPVTMRNSTKNYSIADITDNLDTFVLNDIPERTSAWAGNADFRRFIKIDLSIPNAQSLYIMSLVTQAGLGGTNYLQRSDRNKGDINNNSNYYPSTFNKPVGGFANTGSYGLAPYYKYRSTHVGQYTYVGNCGGSGTSEPTGSEAWYDDFSNAKTDNAQFNRSGGTTDHSWQHGLETIPYLIGKYTPKINSDTTGHTANAYDSNYYTNINGKELGYIAFCLTQQYSYLNLTFSASDSVFYMPDGFRGLGFLGYKNFDNNGNTQWPERYQDLVVHIFGINGNGNTVNLNMSLYNYYQVNGTYDAYAVGNDCPGFGFIDAMMQNKTSAVGNAVNGRYDNIDVTDNDYQIRNLTLTGEVKSVVIDASSGNNYPMNGNINTNYFVAVGGLAGNVVYRAADDIFKVAISDINLSDLKVSGVRNTGGLMGYNQSADNTDSKTTIKNIETSNLEVSSGIYTGGLIGYTTQTAVEISNVTIDEPNIKTNLAFATTSGLSTNATGGIIGYAATGTNNGAVYLHDITIGTESPANGYSAYIGYNVPSSYPTATANETVRVGGLIGQTATNSSTMIGNTGDDHIDYNTLIEKCNVYNVDIYGHKAGGIIGASEHATVYLGVFDTTVSCTNNNANHEIRGALTNTACGAGGIIGYTNNFTTTRNTIQNCLVNGYTIKTIQNAGGIVGNLNSGTNALKICDTAVTNLSLIANSNIGGLVGYQNKYLSGYNVLVNGNQYAGYTNNPTNIGHIVGQNKDKSKVIKIAGFSLRNVNSSAAYGYSRFSQMVGNIADVASGNTNKPYGSSGYVIFADYFNTYNPGNKSTVASTVNASSNVDKNAYKIDTATESDNNFPYITVSPKRTIESGEGGRFLTGDAIQGITYDSSVFKRILDDKSNNVAGAYSNIPSLTNTQKNDISSHFSTSSLQVPSANAPIIPLLVVEDTNPDTITPIINNYLKVLTNTKDYNFAKDETDIYQVSLNKCEYKNGVYIIDPSPTSANLKRTNISGSDVFIMTATHVDNSTEGSFQFSLLDVQFFDPSDSSKIAYHLYVPIYVKKLLTYNFKAAMISNTEYYTSAYGTLNGNSLFENLGNPVTMKFEYKYVRESSDWVDAINGGENMLSNMYKTLSVDGASWPAGTRMVLVDANNKDKYYYLDDPASAISNKILPLNSFIDSSGNHYVPAPLNNLMTVTVGHPSGSKPLTPVTINSELTDENEILADALSKGAIVRSGNTYYRLIDTTAYPDDANLAEEDKYAVTGVSSISSELYYLSIFTPKANDSTIYHFQFKGPDSFNKIEVEEGDTITNIGWRPNQIATNAVVHLYTGDLYENDFNMSVTSRTGDQKLTSSNNHLKVTMTSTIKLKSVPSEIAEGVTGDEYDKTRKGIAGNMYNNRATSSIYQAFLSTYDRKDTNPGISNISINMQAPPFVIIKSYDYYEGVSATGTPKASITKQVTDDDITENYVLLANDVDIIEDLSKSTNEYAVTFKVVYELNYFDEDLLYGQFPPNDEVDPDPEIGTKVIGYSNISSSKESVAFSATSEKDDEHSARFYAAGSSKATLEYNVVKTSGEMLGPYSYLGINPLDVPETKHEIKTVAQYDAHSLKSAGDYIEFSIKLSNKSDYSDFLPLNSYIESLTILGTGNDPIFDSNWANGSIHCNGNVIVTKTENEYRIRVHKDWIQKQGDDDSGRYLFPINFTVYTGDTKFNADTDEETGYLIGLMYSNYKVSVQAELWSAISNGTRSEPSVAKNFLIYTNAKIEPNVIR